MNEIKHYEKRMNIYFYGHSISFGEIHIGWFAARISFIYERESFNWLINRRGPRT